MSLNIIAGHWALQICPQANFSAKVDLIPSKRRAIKLFRSFERVKMWFSAFKWLMLFLLVVPTNLQSISSLPQCGQLCINNALGLAPSLGCSNASDLTCLCRNANFLYGIRDCTVQACPAGANIQQVLQYAGGLCNTTISGAGSAVASSTATTATATNSLLNSPITTVPVVTTITSGGSTITSIVGSSTIFATNANSSARSTSTDASGSVRTVYITQSAVPTAPSPSSPPSLSTSAKAGIGVGVVVMVLSLTAIVIAFIYRRRRVLHRGQSTATRGSSTKRQKAELDAGHVFPPEAFTWKKAKEKPELMTKANTHELEEGTVSATLSGPWSTTGRYELPERYDT